MSRPDIERETLRERVNCAALLERMPPKWRLDLKQSSRDCLKYRSEDDRILIVNHGGKGWWNPLGDEKGDVFDLVQYLQPGLNFGQVRQLLRGYVGVSASYPAFSGPQRIRDPDLTLPQRWSERPRLSIGTQTWSYLHLVRSIPAPILSVARDADLIREGPMGSAWFAHHGDDACLTHVEIRGPRFKGALSGGVKTLFRFSLAPPALRLVLTEAPLDAMSLAALEGPREDTLYAATGGGMGPATLRAIETILRSIAGKPYAVLVSATDANRAGDRYAMIHQTMAAAIGVAYKRLRPAENAGDWNAMLCRRGDRSGRTIVRAEGEGP